MLKIGGKEFELKPLRMNDYIELKANGVDFEKLKTGKIEIEDLRALIYQAVKRAGAGEEINLEWIGENIEMDEISEISEVIGNFFKPKESPATKTT